MPSPNHLIIVCCHGVWTGGPSNGFSEDEWLIADFQRGETATFIEHIKAGLRCLAEDYDNAMLAFSGYANIASSNNFFNIIPSTKNPSSKVLIEDRALDSYHNVLFSLTLFYTRFHTWPAHLTVVSHAFKEPRLVNGHCTAIGFPLERTAFVGIDPPGMTNEENVDGMKGVGQAVDDWTRDPHGRGEVLAGKRRRRNPWGVWQGIFKEKGGDKGGLVTEGEGEAETLVDGAPRPWK
ncbi:uncharacterized protein TRIREDRAFT_69064 [Trichoderma reesei QM6a]|uniref:Predicted protein n=1 Tax=Hypocrea jecorina (strain QM6a) TaxID=431241 RepID=G0RUU7_HYPJQ|nr:uncharacterized protein TRIREDRAFT_69064 [Trichoderma reesei QM6a]EGR45060.1 predicted protein [Trichoderma reesei QM6a]